MSIERVRAYLRQWGKDGSIQEFAASSATVELAAQALGVIPARIAKTLAFAMGEGCLLVVAAGDTRVNGSLFKQQFGCKAKMLSPEEALHWTGFAVGGVCPFAIENSDVQVWLDVSLQRFGTVFPACGSSNSGIELTCEELRVCAKARGWVNVCTGWQDEA